jgi:hypothetical protein
MIVASVGTAARREAMRGQAEWLSVTLDWSRLMELLSIRRLLPTLGPRILELAGERAEEEFRAGVAGAVEAGRRQGAFLQLIAARVMEALAGAGIRSTALKGALLSEALYGDPGRRQSSDIDLLVAEEQLYEAVEVVRTLGYAAPTDVIGDGGLPLLHFALVHERETLPPVELHWRIHWYESRFARDRLLAPREDSAGAWRPAPADELAAMLLFYARDGFIGLRHAADLGAWWDAFGTGLTPGALDEVIGEYPALGPVLAAAVRVAERTVGLPAERIVAGAANLQTRGRIAVRLADPYPHSSEAQIYANMGLIDGLLAPAGGLREFFKRQLAPPREAMQERARGAGRGRISHCARMLGRYGLALTRLLRAPRIGGRGGALCVRTR